MRQVLRGASGDDSRISRTMFALALPVLAEESLNLLVGYSDWFLAGRFLPGDEPKAAMGLVAYVMWMLPSLFSVVGIGALAIVARLVGGGEAHLAVHIMRQAMWLGTLVAIAGMVLTASLADAFVAAMQLQGPAAELATLYIRFLVPVMPLVMFEQVGTACLRGAGDTISGLVARVVVNVVNVTLSALLIIGIGPFPALGFSGLAIGTVAGHCCGGLIILYRCARWMRHASDPRLSATNITPTSISGWFDFAAMRRVLYIGLPGGIDVWTVLLCHLIYAAIINSLGTTAQAAHGLGLQIEALSYLPGSAFSVAAATLAGQSLGARDHRRAVRGVSACTAAAVAIMSAAGLVLYFGGETIGTFFLGRRSETVTLVGQLLKVVSISCPFLAVLSVLVGALRGSGDTRFTLVITLLGLVGIRIPGACLLAWDELSLPLVGIVLPAAGLGVLGAWWAMVTDVVVRSLLVTARFVHGGWQKVQV